MTILDALDDPKLLGRVIRGQTWAAWITAIAAVFGLSLTPEQQRTVADGTIR